VGIFLRELTFGHANQRAAVGRAHLAALAQRTPLLPGIEERVLLDIDSLLRPVYGHQDRAPRSRTPRSPAARCCVWASHRRSPRCQRRPQRR
jgi:hypothetical protein